MDAQRRVVLDGLARAIEGLPLDHPVRVAVDGITAVGKTTFADELAQHIGTRPCARVSMDGFHNPRAVRYRQGRESADGYYEDAYDFAALRRELLEPLGPGGDRRYRTAVIDLAADVVLDDPPEIAPDDLVLVVDGSFLQRPEVRDAWDVVIFLDASFDAARARGAARDAEALGSLGRAEELFRTRYHAAQQRYLDEVQPRLVADVVVGHADPAHPVVRSVKGLARHARVADPAIAREQDFFAPRATEWNEKFEAVDALAFVDAVRQLAPPPGGTVVDVGCGAGRAFEVLSHAVGETGRVIGLDVTPAMLAAARSRPLDVPLVLADAAHAPFADASCDALFGAGLLGHLPNDLLALVELARITRPGGRVALFHPAGRRRHRAAHDHGEHGRDHEDGHGGDGHPAADRHAEQQVAALLAAAGWEVESLDDRPDRYLAIASAAARPPTSA